MVESTGDRRNLQTRVKLRDVPQDRGGYQPAMAVPGGESTHSRTLHIHAEPDSTSCARSVEGFPADKGETQTVVLYAALVDNASIFASSVS